MEIFEKLGILVLGWLLGLLGPAIVDTIRRKRENALGREAILSELHDVGGTLAIAAFAVKSKQGSIDREFLEWLKNQVERGARAERFKVFSEDLHEQLRWSDEEIATRFLFMKSPPGQGTVLQKYVVPLLDSRVSALWSFDTSFQRRLLEIRQYLHRIDDLVDRSRMFDDMTFADHHEENRRRINENYQQVLALYAENTQRLVDMIQKLDVSVR